MTISKYHGVGGADVVIKNLCIGLSKIGYRTAIGAFSFTQNPPQDVDKVILNRFKSPTSNANYDFDIIHCHQTSMVYYSLLTSTPFVFHYHGASNKVQEINLKIAMSLCRKKISKIITVSKTGIEQLKKITGFIGAEVVYNGVDTKNYHPGLGTRYKKGNPQLLFVGNLYPKKNVGILVDAMTEITKMYPDAHLQVVGYGEEFQRLQNKVKQKRLEDKVELLGRISEEELRLRYSSCDMYISASVFEVHPVPPIESLACGKPLVLSDIPAHKEILNSSGAGLSFDISNLKDITNKIHEVFEKKQVFAKTAINFAQKYNWTTSCEKLAKIYAQVLEEN